MSIKNTKKCFVRRIKELGIYTSTIGKKEIRISDFEMYFTDDDEEIDFLMNDPEILECKIKKAKK